MMWTDEELEVMRCALNLQSDQMALSDGYDGRFKATHASLFLRLAEELERRRAIRRLL